MTIEINKFLWSLMAAIESRTQEKNPPGLVWVTDDPTAQRSLWLNEMNEGDPKHPLAADPATVIRQYAGDSPAQMWGRKLTIALQALTRGTQSPVVNSQAFSLQEAMLSDQGRPMVHWRIPGKTLSLADGVWTLASDETQDWQIEKLDPLQTPGIIGRDETGKWMASCNWNCEFIRIAK